MTDGRRCRNVLTSGASLFAWPQPTSQQPHARSHDDHHGEDVLEKRVAQRGVHQRGLFFSASCPGQDPPLMPRARGHNP